MFQLLAGNTFQFCIMERQTLVSSSDGDTSEEEEFSRILYTNNPTVVEDVDETSNSSNPNYTQLVSVSLTTALSNISTCVSFYIIWIFTKYILLIHHNANLRTFNKIFIYIYTWAQWRLLKFSSRFCYSNLISTMFTCGTSPPPLSPNTLITLRNNQSQGPITSTGPHPPLIQTTFNPLHPHAHNFLSPPTTSPHHLHPVLHPHHCHL